ncbi:MAG: hypothetical protein F4W95_02035 [Chloroflexi bacterium]|nr:hypothetical protein [Chloroflexota bacterium]MYD47245.1 hypothetical protein [Chloroflexota bacterium]
MAIQLTVGAVAHFNAAVHIGRIVGLPLVGLVIDHWSIGTALFLNGSCYLASVFSVYWIRLPRRSARSSSESPLGALPLAAAAGWVGWSTSISVAGGLCLLTALWFGLGRASGRQLATTPTMIIRPYSVSKAMA